MRWSRATRRPQRCVGDAGFPLPQTGRRRLPAHLYAAPGQTRASRAAPPSGSARPRAGRSSTTRERSCRRSKAFSEWSSLPVHTSRVTSLFPRQPCSWFSAQHNRQHKSVISLHAHVLQHRRAQPRLRAIIDAIRRVPRMSASALRIDHLAVAHHVVDDNHGSRPRELQRPLKILADCSACPHR